MPDYDTWASHIADEIFTDFYKPAEKVMFENVGPRGELLDSPQGYCVDPGHPIEASWFIMHEGMYRKNQAMINKALEILDHSLEIGWDRPFGGLPYFVDVEGKPPEQLEWDMKLWWPHTEAQYATLLDYSLTGDSRYETWFERIHFYSFSHFADEGHPHWFGYLHQDDTKSNTLKGNLWKGPFHLPRALLLCTQRINEMLKTN